jgi:hypothetical protein
MFPAPLVGIVEVPLGLPVNVTVTVLDPAGVVGMELLQPCSSPAPPRRMIVMATNAKVFATPNARRLRAKTKNVNPPKGKNQAATVVAGAVSVCRVRLIVSALGATIAPELFVELAK